MFLVLCLCGKEGEHTVTSKNLYCIVALTLSASPDHKAVLTKECELLFICQGLSAAFKQPLLTIFTKLALQPLFILAYLLTFLNCEHDVGTFHEVSVL